MNKRLFVAGLPFSSTDSDLKDHFSKAGVITLVQIIIDKFSGRSKGFGFIEFEKEEEAAKAIEMFHETDFGGRKLIVAEAKPMEKREFKPRSGGGDDRRGGYSDDRRPSFGGRPKFTRGGGRTGGFRNDR
ncbi:MAG: RNA-binding protein (RRM domain) [Candidatus Woesebacteria bacterium GW2011_GWA1_33_30]|uniref:RNA-binding protein (RRM domain) n=1 Tax=Candidatus Woesebacteria bacterium GW2011_GWA2_33_28 TaxID=1618561 RepID=A0A0G0CVQ7_9BACT|nr:MAG: RNA-binding protein (RRM domain) [Candidatus Woesebacteria bacterium GW2011_GWA2_33_28]KKP48437.1 MAG: RNA-binding protein (RRM domain) [Candidatus Woesebacteria bacterium GW2011_GWA1_33_30]KKP49544.1 MAG: RNA-binding protein (RRM domain) [Microgenomates group bacterium GW2011_GWC1_33_32]KKP52509.1 MAG: RNA-binding protein (RRM domain) [Candidatus Woesebacteria bacterium GW2011_GWB1_33_38]KKP56371.1 MAG: RNA-binding protein (RRM domain) [Microgenomates group bacterium GW2011_GWD1_33_9]